MNRKENGNWVWVKCFHIVAWCLLFCEYIWLHHKLKHSLWLHRLYIHIFNELHAIGYCIIILSAHIITNIIQRQKRKKKLQASVTHSHSLCEKMKNDFIFLMFIVHWTYRILYSVRTYLCSSTKSRAVAFFFFHSTFSLLDP